MWGAADVMFRWWWSAVMGAWSADARLARWSADSGASSRTTKITKPATAAKSGAASTAWRENRGRCSGVRSWSRPP